MFSTKTQSGEYNKTHCEFRDFEVYLKRRKKKIDEIVKMKS